MCLEETDKMLRILKAYPGTHLVHVQAAIVKQLLGGGKEVIGNEILGSPAGLHFDKRAEISCRKTAFVSKISHSR